MEDEDDNYFSDIDSEISDIESQLSYNEDEKERDGDEYEYTDEPTIVSEFKAFERVGSSTLKFTDNIFESVSKDKLKEGGRFYLKSQLSHDQLFLVDLQKSWNKYEINIGNNDVETIKDIILKINHIQYKNAGAFLLGYYILKQPKQKKDKELKISEEHFAEVKTLIKDSKDIFPEDILRYSSLIWEYIPIKS